MIVHFSLQRRGHAIRHVLFERHFLEMDESVPKRAAADDPDARIVMCAHAKSFIGGGNPSAPPLERRAFI